MRRIYLLYFLLLLIIIPIDVKAMNQESPLFDQLYISRASSNYGGATLYRCECIDEKENIYVGNWSAVNGNNPPPGSGLTGTPFDGSNLITIGLSGILNSDTARLYKVRQWTTGVEFSENDFLNNYSYKLPDDSIFGWFMVDKGETEEMYSDYINYQGNLFRQKNDGFGIDETEVIEFSIQDHGRIEKAILIIGSESRNYEAATLWLDNDMACVTDVVKLYDGTGGSSELLEDYSEKLKWQTGRLTYGISNRQLWDYEDITIDDNIKSVRISYDSEYPTQYNSLAFYPDLPDYKDATDSSERQHMARNYYFYRNKSKMVCINGGDWINIHNGEISPELKLKQGINIIFLAGTSPENAQDEDRLLNSSQGNSTSYIYLLYYDSDNDYEPSETGSSSLKSIEFYQGAYDAKEAKDKYNNIRYNEESHDGNLYKTISLDAEEPYIWINPIPDEPRTTIEIDQAIATMGGFFKRLDTSKSYFDIKLTAYDNSSTYTERIYVKWKGSSACLKSLVVENGGRLEKEYDPLTRNYYCETEGSTDINIVYETMENTTVKVYVDRQLHKTIVGHSENNLSVEVDIKEIEWEIQTDTGKKVIYNVYFERNGENGVSQVSKQRARLIIRKMANNGYLNYLQNTNAGDYWKTYGAASIGPEYLKGMLGYDITQKEFKQSTDYAAAILELSMSGENPYNYLGTNYVEGLLSYNNQGDFGMFSANIWALTALQVAGAEIPDKTIEIVKKQALSESFDLDMRGWACYAISFFKDRFKEDEYASLINSLKNTQLKQTTEMNGIDVTGVFENFYYTNRNIMSHACVVSGLVSLGLDPGAQEFQGRNGADALSIFERYQTKSGGFFYSPLQQVNGGYNKDAVIAVGDIYNGSNVYTRYYLTEDRYSQLVFQAGQMLEDDSLDPVKREALQEAYEEASGCVSDGDGISCHGEAYYALQDAMTAVDESMSPGVFLGTAEERDQVNEVKEEIERISSYSYADKKDLDQIKEKYDALGEERLYHYIRNSEVLDKAYGYVKGIDDFLETVNKIGTVNLTKTAKIKKARKAYDALSDRQKAETVVKEALMTLQDAEAAIIKMNDSDKVERAIGNLGSIVTLDMQDDIEAVREAYDSLSDADKAKVTNVKDLEKAEENLRDLLARETAIDNAAAVTEKIASIGDVSRNSEDAIRQAREAYDALETEEEKNLVSNYRTLLDSETEYANLLDREELGNALSEADYHINRIYQAFGDSDQLGEDNCQDVSEAVEEAGRFFEQEEDKRTDFCQMVSGYPSYVDVRTMIAEYTFDPDRDASLDNLEGILDSIGDVTLDREPDARKAEMILETLRASDETSDDLGAYETRISSLREEITAIRDSYPDICSLVTAIESVGEVSQTYQDAYLEAANLYNNAEEALISRIPASAIETITAAGNKYGELQEEMEEISRIEGQIEDTRQVSSLLDEEAVVSARDAYEGSGRKESISNYLTLLEAERKIVSLKKAVEDAQIAAEVEDMIGLLNSGSGIDPADVALARVAYDALTDAQKKLVGNYADLKIAEEKVGNLPSPSDDTDPKGSTIPAKRVVYTMSLIRNKKASKPYLIGKKTKYKLVLKANGKAVIASKVKWKSGKKAIASISKNVVTFKKKGTVKITAVYQGKKHSFSLKVKKASFKLKKKKITLKKGKKYRIRYTALPKGKVTFRSMDKKIATVTKKGIVKSRRKGQVKIRVKCNGITKYQSVSVK